MTDPISSAWEAQRSAMGAFIRSQRELANLSLREFSRMSRVSNAYLSQIERGQNDPTLRVLVQIGDALQLSVEEILRIGALHAGTADGTESEAGGTGSTGGVESAIRSDPVLSKPEKEALVAVYRSYLQGHEGHEAQAGSGPSGSPKS